ncbi:hypothetical protein ACFLSE_10600 [Bacteroidota bacterium]
MKYLLTILSFLVFTTAFGQKNTKRNLVKELAENGGQLIIFVNYSIGEANYSEQFIIVEKIDSLLQARIHIDTASYFNKFKNFGWSDTVLLIDNKSLKNFIELEKHIFKKGIKPTYNCDGDNGRIVHNMTSLLFLYDSKKLTDSKNIQIDSLSRSLSKNITKSTKMKSLNISGGFVSMRDELINLGLEFKRCKTHWWEN